MIVDWIYTALFSALKVLYIEFLYSVTLVLLSSMRSHSCLVGGAD